uniref:Uncharacterized protein C15orf65 homolog n=1 Tax=Geotrypetes seraphini TaxID=260995 RepID=A0A6P8P3T7_GEOSA|nr:uncharacterized protein C15orf65 homolog [Geotrypetes seraphini]XP_033775640.1 uncharacterized protein C15orf65 homolog [Geotrypetes seraphini]
MASTDVPPASFSRKKESLSCTNPGNPVFSCMIDARAPPSKMSLTKAHSILYKTTSDSYGALPTYCEIAPCSHHPLTQRFSDPLGICGMYRNHSFNTALDRSKVYDDPILQHTV